MEGFNKALMGLLGAAMFANGLFMLYNPAAWYFAVPTVPATGPFNQHFLRDIGLVYVLIGIGYAAGAAVPAQRLWIWGAATSWLALHGFFHLWEIGTGICGPATILENGVAVYGPATFGLAGMAIELRARRQRKPAVP